MKGELKNVNMSQQIILDVSIDTWTVGDVSAPRAGGGCASLDKRTVQLYTSVMLYVMYDNGNDKL